MASVGFNVQGKFKYEKGLKVLIKRNQRKSILFIVFWVDFNLTNETVGTSWFSIS